MIFRAKKDGWKFFFTDEKFLRAFDEILDALKRRAGTVLGADTESRRLRLILKATVPGLGAGTPFVLKREWFVFRFDRTLKSFLFGSNARSILKASDRADAEGFRDFCRTFFVAERSRLGVLRETVSVIEFLDGHSLDAEATLIDGGENGWATGIKCVRMKLTEPDASGRRRPCPVEGSEFVFPADMVIVALGTSPNPLITHSFPALKTGARGVIETDENLMTNIENVYAGGDAVTGAATVILAMGAGRKAARSIIRKLIGE